MTSIPQRLTIVNPALDLTGGLSLGEGKRSSDARSFQDELTSYEQDADRLRQVDPWLPATTNVESGDWEQGPREIDRRDVTRRDDSRRDDSRTVETRRDREDGASSKSSGAESSRGAKRSSDHEDGDRGRGEHGAGTEVSSRDDRVSGRDEREAGDEVVPVAQESTEQEPGGEGQESDETTTTPVAVSNAAGVVEQVDDAGFTELSGVPVVPGESVSDSRANVAGRPAAAVASLEVGTVEHGQANVTATGFVAEAVTGEVSGQPTAGSGVVAEEVAAVGVTDPAAQGVEIASPEVETSAAERLRAGELVADPNADLAPEEVATPGLSLATSETGVGVDGASSGASGVGLAESELQSEDGGLASGLGEGVEVTEAVKVAGSQAASGAKTNDGASIEATGASTEAADDVDGVVNGALDAESGEGETGEQRGEDEGRGAESREVESRGAAAKSDTVASRSRDAVAGGMAGVQAAAVSGAGDGAAVQGASADAVDSATGLPGAGRATESMLLETDKSSGVSEAEKRDAAFERLNPAQQRRLFQRVSRAFELAQNRGGEIRLRLAPAHLGSMKLELRLDGQQLTARLETETQQARQLLTEHLPALRDRLSEQGIQIESFEIDLYQDDTRESHSELLDRRQDDESPGERAASARQGVGEVDEDVESIDESVLETESGRLNVVI